MGPIAAGSGRLEKPQKRTATLGIGQVDLMD
jgi:hypothetical protein